MAKSTTSSVDKRYKHYGAYFFLISLRLSFIFYLTPGYIYPDEYFQSIELASHDIFTNSCSLLTWEFRPTGYGPVRSRSSIYPLVHFPIKLALELNPVSTFKQSGSVIIQRTLLPARIFTAILSFIPDLFIFYISKKLENLQNWEMPISLLLYSSMAYGGLLYNTHTLSNIWETVLVCIFCYLSLHISFLNIVLEAAIGAYGIFLRSSFPIFVFPFILYQLYNISRLPNRIAYIIFIIPFAVLVSCLVAASLIFLDTIYYTNNTISCYTDLVITPWRFFKYNSAEETLSEHGLHPWYHYIAIHWPLVLTPFVALLVIVPPSRKGFSDGLRYVVWFSVVLPTVFLSLCPHKETRFILPSLPFAACLAPLRWKRSKSLLILWMCYQMGLFIFWGYLHQAGILPFLQALPANDADDVSLNIFYKTYMPPRFPFGAPRNSGVDLPTECLKLVSLEMDECQRVVDLAGRSQREFFDFMNCLEAHATKNLVIRVILPGSVLPLQKSLRDYGDILRVDTFFPHLSTENFPSLTMPHCPQNMDFTECLSIYLDILMNQLSLHSYKIALS